MNTIGKCVLMMIMLSSAICFAQQSEHIQDIHKYITYQAWELVKAEHPEVINSVMNQRIGHWQDGSLNGTGPWQKGNVVTGAYREDEEDVVYGYPFPYVSATHFWDADLGDNAGFNPPPYNHIYENAYKKMQAYWSGRAGDRNWLEIGPFFYNLIPYYVRVKYDTLHNAYKDHSKFVVTHWLDIGNGFWYEENPPMPLIPFLVKNSNSYSYAEGDALAKRICWEIVGRMCHLIEDSGIPAHAHNDLHLFGDYFETTYIPQVYSGYSWLNAHLQGGLVNINNKAYPLRYAIFTTNQIADRFSSDDFDGDGNIYYSPAYSGENYEQQIAPAYQYISSQNITNTTPPPAHAYVAANRLFVYTIRSVAGFLWYVYNKFGISSEQIPRITGFDYSLPDQFIFNGETLELTCNATGSNLNYQWLVRVCDTSNRCNANIPGLAITTQGNKIRISNQGFKNNWTCLKYDSLCTGGGSNAAPDPMHLYIGVKISNLAGSDSKFYNFNEGRLVSIHPNQHLRPGPFSGCPVAMTNNGNGFVYENNILHKSEFQENKDKDITDKLVLRTQPAMNPADSTLTIAIDESSIDRSYFDNFKLLSVEHPANTILAVTNNNELVTFNASQILSPIVAELSGNDVTEILQYDTTEGKSVSGFTKDQMYAKFPGLSANEDTIGIIFDASPPPKYVIPIVKDVAGELTAYDEDGGYNSVPINFAMRQIASPVVIPLWANKNVTVAEMYWKRDFNISYVALSQLKYGGMQITEQELVFAEDIVAGNVLQLLKYDDNIHAELDSTTSIILKFKSNSAQPQSGKKRSYVLISNGRYEKPNGFRNETNSLNENQHVNVNNNKPVVELLPNVPNPFNPVTSIRFNLPEDAFTEVSVFDIAGRMVAKIAEGVLAKGFHQYSFDAAHLSSGAYYIRLKTDKKSLVRKMMLVK
jgi:hypothetical protein